MKQMSRVPHYSYVYVVVPLFEDLQYHHGQVVLLFFSLLHPLTQSTTQRSKPMNHACLLSYTYVCACVYVHKYMCTSREARLWRAALRWCSFDSGPSTALRQLCLHDRALNGPPRCQTRSVSAFSWALNCLFTQCIHNVSEILHSPSVNAQKHGVYFCKSSSWAQ